MMLGIFGRYVARETAWNWCGVVGVLVLVIVVNRFAVYLGEAASGQIPAGISFVLIGLSVAGLLEIVLPVSLFLAAMLTLGRLYRDGEAVAGFVCGLTPGRLYRPFAVLGVIAALILAWLALYVSPWTAALGHRIEQSARSEASISLLVPGQFKNLPGGGVFYAGGASDDGKKLLDVFAATEEDSQTVMLAGSQGKLISEGENGARHLEVAPGHRYAGIPGQLDWTVTRFRSASLLVRPATPEAGVTDPDRLPTAQLSARDDPVARATLQWRLVQPFTVLVLLLIAVPLAHIRPRQGRFARLVPAILVYLVYFNLLGVVRVWVGEGTIPLLPGLWLVPLVFALGGIGLIYLRFARRLGGRSAA
ncbi:MAG TPA: LPS export ABC transporter permease LptF [Gammaproteobacteria bacterium]|nr:LPS export ABC transporter permease LptF [Gammaproteobacteria bacterium]